MEIAKEANPKLISQQSLVCHCVGLSSSDEGVTKQSNEVTRNRVTGKNFDRSKVLKSFKNMSNRLRSFFSTDI